MNPLEIRTLQLLKEIDKNHSPSQRHLARRLNVSLGHVNSFIKRLARKGYFKITHIPQNRIRYILTSKGALEKTRLTHKYIKFSYIFYKGARRKFLNLLRDLESRGVKRLVFWGATDLAEIAYLSLHETDIRLVAVLDDQKIGEKFFNFPVKGTYELNTIIYDQILLTATESIENMEEKLRCLEIDYNRLTQIA